MATPPPVALITYSTKPRGGVSHTLALGEALQASGYPVLIVGLGDPEQGFFRPVAAPTLIVPAPAPPPGGGLEAKVDANIDALEAGLTEVAAGYPVLHTQDCISARAAARVRDAGPGRAVVVVRTVHHVDDFDTEKLMDCQRQAILEPDHVLVVSQMWQRILAADYGVQAELAGNGVAVERFATAGPGLVWQLREKVAPAGPLVLSVGGIEPRKGTDTLVRALARLHAAAPPGAPRPVLAVIGGHSFQDHRWYREQVLAELPGLGLAAGRDVVELGTVPDQEIPAWYRAADVLAFPSVKEGFGLAPLEAMAAGTPVVVSDLPVFGEWLTPSRDALQVPVGDDTALAAALGRVLADRELAARLREAGYEVARRHSWAAEAGRHQRLYQRFRAPAAR
ncbi:MAG: MSMEG_0565 family glycosyltransferase [Actinobacteria bacterium]|nr:MSMEG_0565 family glycosyltransferase [Actinomycetota bacterium]